MIHVPAGGVAKYTPPLAAALAAFDWPLAGGILFGFFAGWAGAVALIPPLPGAGRRMWQQFRASLLASGIGLLIVLWAIRLGNLDPLGAATVSAIVGILGVNAVEIFRNGGRNWLRGFIRTASDALKDERKDS